MKEKVYIDRLFADYEDTPEIRYFKEEITGNLKERIKELVIKGLDEEKAFDKATAELGDITAIADDVGKKTRNEAIVQMYMKAKVPVTKRTAGGLIAASGLLLLAVGLTLAAFFTETGGLAVYYISGILLSFPFGLYTYFGLTQETTAHYAMKKGRALACGVVLMIAFLGTGLAVVSFLNHVFEMSIAFGIQTSFGTPAICALFFLLVTAPKRQKPLLKAMVEQEIEKSMEFHQDMVDPVKAARFGVASGGLWILAIAIYITLGYITLGIFFSLLYALLVFSFALVFQIFIILMIFKKKK